MSGRTRPLVDVPGLYELADRQLGVVSRGQLRALGVNRHHVRSQLTAQRWQTIGRRVIAVMTGTLTPEQHLWVAYLNAGRGSVLWGRTALQHVGMRGWEADGIHIGVPHDARVPVLAGVVIHRLRTRDEADIAVVRGLPTHRPGRAVAEAAAAERSVPAAAGLVTAAIQQRITSDADVLAAASRWPRLRHRVHIVAACSDAAGGADSRAEADAARLVRRAGLPEPRRQAVIETAEGPRRVDLAVELQDGTLLVIEIDGPHHGDPRVAAEDSRKDAAVLARGGRVLRLPAYLVRSDPDRVVRQIADIAEAARRRSGGRFAS